MCLFVNGNHEAKVQMLSALVAGSVNVPLSLRFSVTGQLKTGRVIRSSVEP
jgi:hypothetical protein